MKSGQNSLIFELSLLTEQKSEKFGLFTFNLGSNSANLGYRACFRISHSASATHNYSAPEAQPFQRYYCCCLLYDGSAFYRRHIANLPFQMEQHPSEPALVSHYDSVRNLFCDTQQQSKTAQLCFPCASCADDSVIPCRPLL